MAPAGVAPYGCACAWCPTGRAAWRWQTPGPGRLLHRDVGLAGASTVDLRSPLSCTAVGLVCAVCAGCGSRGSPGYPLPLFDISRPLSRPYASIFPKTVNS